VKIKVIDLDSAKELAFQAHDLMPVNVYLTKSDEQLITIKEPESTSKKLFKLDSRKSFVECISVIGHYIAKKRRIHVQILSEDKFKFQEVRAAYFCYLKELPGQADSDGSSVQELHSQYKAAYLLPILSREYQWFGDLVLEAVNNENVKQAVDKLLSVADGSILNTKLFIEYFNAIQRSKES